MRSRLLERELVCLLVSPLSHLSALARASALQADGGSEQVPIEGEGPTLQRGPSRTPGWMDNVPEPKISDKSEVRPSPSLELMF